MNYVQHTRAAHEHLRARPEARPHHVSLYWALFYQWNAARFTPCLDLDHQATMQAARIGNERTYRATLYDLDAWGLLAYQPSQSRHERSRCFLADLSEALLPPISQPTPGRSASGKSGLSGALLPQALRAEVPEDTLYSKTNDVNSVVVNGPVAAPQKKIELLEGEGLSGVELFDDNAPTQLKVSEANGTGPDQASALKKKVALKKKGVRQDRQAEAIRATATAPRAVAGRGRTTLPELPFRQSPLAQVENFIAAFQGTDYELADLRHYHQLVATWRDKKTGLEPTRKDWVATAKRFMLNDAADNRLKLAPAHRPQHHPGPDANDPGAFSARTGFRSKYDT